jgi:Trk K+ transport system NAD-binding subunit
MKIIIIGAGLVGCQIAKQMSERGHAPILVDKDEKSFEKLPNHLVDNDLITTVQGDGNDSQLIKTLNANESDAVITATGNDALNGMIAQKFNILLKSKNSKNIKVILRGSYLANLYESLGFSVINKTEKITQLALELIKI